MPSLDNITPDSRFMGLFIGRSGTGKKSAAASFPRPIKFWDFDGRIRGIMGCPWIDKKGLGDVTFFPPKKQKGTGTVFEDVNKEAELLLGQANVGQNPYKTLYMGSLTGETFALLCDAMPLTHGKGSQGQTKGKMIGTLNMAGPEDYGFESTGTYQLLAFLRALKDHPTGIPNIIVAAHVIDRYGKPTDEQGNEDPYAEKIVVGEKLSLRDKISENSQIYFDHIFRFDKRMIGQEPHHYVKFRTDIARTTFEKLPNGELDITGKLFYDILMERAGFRNDIK